MDERFSSRLITVNDWRAALQGLNEGIINTSSIEKWRSLGTDWKQIVALCVDFNYWSAAAQLIQGYNLAPADLSLKQQLALIALETLRDN